MRLVAEAWLCAAGKRLDVERDLKACAQTSDISSEPLPSLSTFLSSFKIGKKKPDFEEYGPV